MCEGSRLRGMVFLCLKQPYMTLDLQSICLDSNWLWYMLYKKGGLCYSCHTCALQLQDSCSYVTKGGVNM